MKNLKIGPCGHTYGLYNGKWTHIISPSHSLILYNYLILKNKRNKYITVNSCTHCVMKIDTSGNLWYKNQGKYTGYYDTFS